MGKSDEALKHFIKDAIKLEIDGRAFFHHAAEMTHNELGKKMFLRLAAEEVKHMETLNKIFSSVTKSDEWRKHVKKEDMESPSSVIQHLAARMARAESKNEIEAIRIGMELELKAIYFFKNASAGIDDKTVKEIFEKIAEE